jgi:hypothetical protein
LELILCLLDVLRNDFGEVDEAMILAVERPFKFIYYILGIVKTSCTKKLK